MKITPAGVKSEYSTGASGSQPLGLTAGPDGNLWFADAGANAIGKITTSGSVTEYPLPHPSSFPTSITQGAGSSLVFTEAYGARIGKITTSGAITEYALSGSSGGPGSVVKGSDGNVYFTDTNSSSHVEEIGKFNTSTYAITETAQATGSAPDQTWTYGPGEMAAGSGVVWFVDDGNHKIDQYNTSTGATTQFGFPAGTTGVFGLTLASDGTVWFTEGSTGRVGRLYPATAAVTEYQTNPASLGSEGITQGPDGNIWLVDWNNNQVYTLAGGGPCTTRQYSFDADTNRTGLTTTTAGSVVCATGGSTQTYSYDTADRLTGTGIAYDAFGRITALPAALADPAGTNALTSGFYVNDRVQQLNQSGQAINYTLDPGLRIRQRQTTVSGTTTYENSYYDGSSDTPAWTQNVTSGGTPTGTWNRNITAVDGNVAAIQTNTATTLQLTDLHGNVVATAPLSSTATAPTTACDATEYGVPRTITGSCLGTSRYAWLGGKGRPTELPSGVISMGVRIYLPTLGAFLQADPIQGGGADAYGYADGDPINGADPSGTATKKRGRIYNGYLSETFTSTTTEVVDGVPRVIAAATVTINLKVTTSGSHWTETWRSTTVHTIVGPRPEVVGITTQCTPNCGGGLLSSPVSLITPNPEAAGGVIKSRSFSVSNRVTLSSRYGVSSAEGSGVAGGSSVDSKGNRTAWFWSG